MAANTSGASAAPGVGMPQARLPPLQQGAGYQGGPAAGPVPADWARAYREQQHKAAQVRHSFTRGCGIPTMPLGNGQC